MNSDLDIKMLIEFSKTLKILYVEDNKVSREALETLLGNFFSDITTAFNGEEALEKFKNNKFDLVITDIRMPKMNGIDLMKKIRKIDNDIPLIVSTAHKESELLIECIELGVNGYLLKPINHKQLTRAVNCICGRLYYLEETKKYERSLEELVNERTKELENIQTKLMHMTHKDPLTNLYNRRHFNEIVNTLMHIAYREKSALSVLMIDIDRFKNINDTYGHLIGDIVLQELAKILTKKIRRSDVAIRFGGEEFLVLLPNTTIKGAQSMANKIKKSSQETTIALSHSPNIVINFTVSIGISQCRCMKNEDKNTFIDRADKAMYRAKESGRNRVVVYDE
ncbi:MAG: hypothetical protein DRG78_19175 [Epsilonproteobacteria bacterium]|nr:MAG: hypothetical protein DRG78_19175 [Campylobacterota bacterium]